MWGLMLQDGQRLVEDLPIPYWNLLSDEHYPERIMNIIPRGMRLVPCNRATGVYYPQSRLIERSYLEHYFLVWIQLLVRRS